MKINSGIESLMEQNAIVWVVNSEGLVFCSEIDSDLFDGAPMGKIDGKFICSFPGNRIIFQTSKYLVVHSPTTEVLRVVECDSVPLKYLFSKDNLAFFTTKMGNIASIEVNTYEFITYLVTLKKAFDKFEQEQIN